MCILDGMFVVCLSGLERDVCLSCAHCFVFFFSSRRRHTRCLSDWSSDVCSSDLFDTRAFVNVGGTILEYVTAYGKNWTWNNTVPTDQGSDLATSPRYAEACGGRSEERRVGKECRSRRTAYDEENRSESKRRRRAV